jgi:hypothetical protein
MSRYFRRGTSVIYFVPGTSKPTTATAVTAGTDLTDAVAEISGFTFTNSPIPTPDMGAAFTKSIPGEDTAEDSSMTFYENPATGSPEDDARTALPKGQEGFVVLVPHPAAVGGPAATGDKVEIWPVISTGVNREWSAGNDPARFMVQFAITDVPDIELALT